MKEITKEQENKLYKLMRLLFFILSVLLFVVVENYIAIQIFRKNQVAVKDLPVACVQTEDGKYQVSTEKGYVEVYNGTGRTVKDLVVTVRYVAGANTNAFSYEIEAGEFEPYIKDGIFNAYGLSFEVQPQTETLFESSVNWLEFDVVSYSLETTTFDYLMIGVFVIACVSLAMSAYSHKICKAMGEGNATSVAVIGEPEEKTEEVKPTEPVEEKKTTEASAEEIEEFLNELEESDILL